MQRLALALALAAALGPLAARAQLSTRAEHRGSWVPASADCSSPLHLRVEATHVALVNAGEEEIYADIGWPVAYFGPSYQGISVVALPEISSGNSPFTVIFNADDKPGVTKLVIVEGKEIPGAHPAYNENIRARKELNRRFPLDRVPLKKCGGLPEPAPAGSSAAPAP